MLGIASKPKFVIPKKSREEWGEVFVKTAQQLLAQSSQPSLGTSVDSSIRGAAALTEALAELSDNQ